jgi:opacity protein-like surface antigen
MKVFVVFLLTTVIFSSTAFAEPSGRAGRWEWSLQPFAIGSKTYDFEAGASARVDSGFGLGLGYAHNVNDYLALGVEGALATADYRAGVAPGAGNPNPAFTTTGILDLATVRLTATWNLLASRFTPFVTANAGATYLQPDLLTDPPAAGCWSYPWWGEVCGADAPTHGMTRFSWGAGAGLRLDLPREQGFLRALVSGETIDLPGPPGRARYVQFRADFGLKF